MTARGEHLPYHAALLLMLLSSGWTACGKTSRSDGPKSSDTGGAGGSGGSLGHTNGSSTTATLGVTSSTGNAVTSSTGGSGGFGTSGSTGFDNSTTSSELGCGAHDRQLEECHGLSQNTAGAAGAGGDSVWDWECWIDVPYNCEVSFEGQALQVGRKLDETSCDFSMFDGGANLGPERKQWLVIGDGIRTIRIAIGGPEGDLDVEVGDTVAVNLVHQLYQEEFFWGSRMTLTNNGNFLAVLNETIPVSVSTPFGDLELSRGDEVCERPADGSTCSYFAHEFQVGYADESFRVPPNSRTYLAPYEIVTENNFVMRGSNGAGCNSSSGSNFVIARVKP